MFGRLIGIAVGVMGTVGASASMESLALHLSPGTIVLANGFSMAVGLFFGIYPAIRASRLNPIHALRYE